MGNKASLSAEEKVSLMESTDLTLEEVETGFENWLKCYPDGKLTKKNFRELMLQCKWASDPDKVDIDKMESRVFRMMDSNNDGKVTFQEFQLVLWVLNKGSMERNLDQLFLLLDVNQDGKVDKKEMTKLVKDMHKLLSEEEELGDVDEIVQDAFKEMDGDENGKISSDEFKDAIASSSKISVIITKELVDIFV